MPARAGRAKTTPIRNWRQKFSSSSRGKYRPRGPRRHHRRRTSQSLSRRQGRPADRRDVENGAVRAHRPSALCEYLPDRPRRNGARQRDRAQSDAGRNSCRSAWPIWSQASRSYKACRDRLRGPARKSTSNHNNPRPKLPRMAAVPQAKVAAKSSPKTLKLSEVWKSTEVKQPATCWRPTTKAVRGFSSLMD